MLVPVPNDFATGERGRPAWGVVVSILWIGNLLEDRPSVVVLLGVEPCSNKARALANPDLGVATVGVFCLRAAGEAGDSGRRNGELRWCP